MVLTSSTICDRDVNNKGDGKRTNIMSKSSNIAKRRKSALSVGGSEYKAKRDELVALAAQLFKDKGYKATTLADVAKHAGLDRATVYYYVGNKRELFREAGKGILDSNVAEAEKILRDQSLDPKQKICHLMEKLMISYDESYPQMYVYIQEEMHEVAKEPTPWAKEMMEKTRYFENAVRTIIREGMETGMFRRDIPERLATNALFGMFNWTHRWYNPKGPQTAKEIAEAFCKIFFEGTEVTDPRPAK